MILQALKEYYDRKSSDADSDIAPPGWEWKEIIYVVVLDKEGNVVDLRSTIEGSGKNKTIKRFLLPQGPKRTVGIAANPFWDTPEYALGIPVKATEDRVQKQHEAFKRRIDELEIDDAGVNALKRFLKRTDKKELIETFPEWENMQKDNRFLVFKLDGTRGIITDSEAVKNALSSDSATHKNKGFCMLTGEPDEIEQVHADIKGVWGGTAKGGTIVGFNSEAYCSFGKNQGENAPIGKKAAFAFATALNTMLAKGSKNRMQVGDASTVAWASTDTPFEAFFFAAFGEPTKDNPDAGVEAVTAIFDSIQSGVYLEQKDEERFYVLGLAPNAARISIRFWQVASLQEIARRVASHFAAMEIDRPPGQPKYLSLFRLLVSTASLGKSENIPPNLGGDVMRTILAGLPYPATLFQAAIRRNRAEQQVTYTRAAAIKACLNKSNNRQPDFKELTVSLDKENKNIGYLLGRLFAVLEKIQAEANPGINATIRDRFYGAASGTPATVFGNLMRLKNHHLSKLENTGRRIYFEKLLGEIIDGIDGRFPPHLSLDNQGCFAIGYYHQVQDFYRKKEKPEETVEE